MKKNLLKGLFCVIMVLQILEISAQAVKITGEVRTRTEMRNGFQSPIGDNDSAAVVTNMRTRINLLYTSNVMKAKITLQDTRTFGQTAPNTTATANTGIYEAWGEYLIAPGVSAAIGRQALEYDDKRLLSASNWSNTGNAHDVLLLKYSSVGWTAHAGFAANNAKDENVYKSVLMAGSPAKQYYKNLNFLWLTKSVGNAGTSAIFVNEAFQKDTISKAKYGNSQLIKNNYRNTTGGNLWFNSPSFPVNCYLTGYYQFGHQYQLKKKLIQNIDAFLLAGKVQGKLHKYCTLTVGEDYFSGTSVDVAKVGATNNSFGKLYGVNHIFNGSMEYWTTPPTQGLSDFFVGLESKPTDKLKAEAVFHKFDLPLKPATGSKDLGSELDIACNYEVSPELMVQAGYSVYFTTKAVNTAKSITSFSTLPIAHWAFVMVSFKPKFL
ncbi:MAG: alginate export family protein [Bacteroidales bacterium]